MDRTTRRLLRVEGRDSQFQPRAICGEDVDLKLSYEWVVDVYHGPDHQQNCLEEMEFLLSEQ